MVSTGFSWADEVEKEEQQMKSQQKSNPFGSARPREVVLEEKGVDWRKLDQQIHRPSNLRKEQPKADERITAAMVDRREEYPQRHKGNVQDRIGPQSGPPNLQNPNDMADVPPFKYLPKNAMYLLGERQRPCLERFDVRLRPYPEMGFPETHIPEFDREWGREDMDYERVQANYNLNTMEDSRRSHIEKSIAELKSKEWGEENLGFASRRDFAGNKRVLDRNLGLEVSRGRRAHGNMDPFREGFGGDYNNRRVSLTSEEGDWHEREYQRETRNFEAEGRARYDPKMEKTNFGRNFGSGGRRVSLTHEDSHWDNTDYQCQRRNFEAEELRGSAQHDLKMEKVNIGGKFRKRSLSSAPGPSHYNQRRRG